MSSPVAKQTPTPAEATATAPVQAEPPKVTLTPRDVQQHMERMILSDDIDNAKIVEWVNAHAQGHMRQCYFIRAIANAICRGYVESE